MCAGISQVDSLDDDVKAILNSSGRAGQTICECLDGTQRDEEAACRAAWELLQKRGGLNSCTRTLTHKSSTIRLSKSS